MRPHERRVISSKPIGVNCFLFLAGRSVGRWFRGACNFDATSAHARAVAHSRPPLCICEARRRRSVHPRPSRLGGELPYSTPYSRPRYMFLVGFGPDSPACLSLLNKQSLYHRSRACDARAVSRALESSYLLLRIPPGRPARPLPPLPPPRLRVLAQRPSPIFTSRYCRRET